MYHILRMYPDIQREKVVYCCVCVILYVIEGSSCHTIHVKRMLIPVSDGSDLSAANFCDFTPIMSS